MLGKRNLIVVIALGVLMSIGVLVSCGQQSDSSDEENVERVKRADSLVRVRLDKNPEDALACIDSLEATELFSKPVICYCRGIVYNKMMQRTTSELYFKKALEGDALQRECPELYYKASDHLSSFLSNRGENAEALNISTRAYEVAQGDDSSQGKLWTACILHSMGYFQTQLGMKEQAEINFSMAYMALSQIVQADSCYENILTHARVSLNILDAYTTIGQYELAQNWVASAEVAADRLSASPLCTDADRAKFVGGIALEKALVMLKMGSSQSAEEAYRKAQNVGYFNTTSGLMDQAHFLKTAERWNELADLMPKVDSLATAWNVPMSLYYVKEYMAPRFNAYHKSGRQSEAMAVAELMAESVDSVAAYEMNRNMKEIAAITKQKDQNTEEAKQEAALAYRWVKILSTMLVFLIVCILAGFIYRFVKSKKN